MAAKKVMPKFLAKKLDLDDDEVETEETDSEEEDEEEDDEEDEEEGTSKKKATPGDALKKWAEKQKAKK